MMFQSPRRFPVLVAVSFVWCVRTAFAGGAALDLAGDASDAVVVNDIGQHTVITVDAAGVRGGPSVLAPDTTWRLDADRRVPGRAVLAAIADLGKADPAPRLSLRLGDPRPQLDVPQISVVPGIELVVPDENGMPLVAIDAGGSWTLMRLSMDRETVLYELRRRLRATASKRVVVEVAPDRPWQDTLELVVVARQAGAAAIVLYDPARPLPSPAAPPPPPSVGGVPRRFHHSELEVVSQVPIDVPVELRPTTQVRCLSTVTIDPTGVPTEVVVEACPEALHGPVRASMMQWRWKSPVYDGAAVAGITMIGVVIQP